MKPIFWAGVIWALTAGAALAQDASREITARMKAFVEVFNAGDADGVAQFYAEDAALLAPGQEALIGREQIKAQFANAFANDVVNLRTETLEVEQPSADTAIEIGRTTVTFGGGTARGRYLHVWKREDGVWMVSRDIYNVIGVTE